MFNKSENLKGTNNGGKAAKANHLYDQQNLFSNETDNRGVSRIQSNI